MRFANEVRRSANEVCMSANEVRKGLAASGANEGFKRIIECITVLAKLAGGWRGSSSQRFANEVGEVGF